MTVNNHSLLGDIWYGNALWLGYPWLLRKETSKQVFINQLWSAQYKYRKISRIIFFLSFIQKHMPSEQVEQEKLNGLQ